MREPMIEVRDLHISFGAGARRVRAVDGVSFRVGEGETYGLVGESGSGKSTVLRAVSGLLTQWQGEISVGGKAVASKRSPNSFKQVQMVFQDPYGSLHPRHTVNAALLESIAIQRMDRGAERVASVLAQVGLGPVFRYRYPHQLSGGQRQRVAIARALILEPAVLLLDEPTSALDVSVQAEILNLLVTVRKARDLTCILVSHDLSVIAHMCDRLGVMNHGKLLEELTVEELAGGRAAHPYTRELLQASLGYSTAKPRTERAQPGFVPAGPR